jgi:hypothetical protein
MYNCGFSSNILSKIFLSDRYCEQHEPKAILDNGSASVVLPLFFVHPNKNIAEAKRINKFFIEKRGYVVIIFKFMNFL